MGYSGNLYAQATEVITSQGDLRRGDSSGNPERLAIGSANQVLQSNGTTESWQTLSTAASVLTTQGDILVEGASGLERLGQSTDGFLLTTKGAGANPVWAAAAAGATTTITDDYMNGGSQSTTSTTPVAINLTGTTLQSSGKALGVFTIAWYSSNVGGDAMTIYLVDGTTDLPAIATETRDQNTPQSCSRAYTATCASQAITADFFGQAGVLLYINGRAIGHPSSAYGNMTSLHTLEVA